MCIAYQSVLSVYPVKCILLICWKELCKTTVASNDESLYIKLIELKIEMTVTLVATNLKFQKILPEIEGAFFCFL